MKKHFLLVAAFLGALTLAGCGGGGDNRVEVASSDALATITPANGSNVVNSVINKDFTFDSGVPEFGTTGPTTLTFVTQQSVGLPDNAAPGNPAFKIASGTGSATGIVEFGSCKFRVVTSNFPAGSPLAPGNTVTISSCQLSVATAGVIADNTAVPRNAILILNGRRSRTIIVTVQVSPSGVVTVNLFVIATVPVNQVTGG
jgi:hypothetical protein